MMKNLRFLVVLLAAFFVTDTVLAQKKSKTKQQTPAAPAAKADTTKRKPGGLQPYNQVITAKAKTQKGLFTSHVVNEDYFFEIDESVLGREFIAVTRISKAPAGAGYGGEERNRQVLKWEKGPGNKLFLKAVLYLNASADTTKAIMEAVRNSNMEPIVAAFDVKAMGTNKSYVINVTEFLKGDQPLVSLNPEIKRRFSLTALQKDRTFIQSVKSFPINTEVRMVKTFASALPPPSAPNTPARVIQLPAGEDTGFVTMELNLSMVLLPEVPARKRLFDNRVGYFATGYTVYAEESQRSETEVFAVRLQR